VTARSTSPSPELASFVAIDAPSSGLPSAGAMASFVTLCAGPLASFVTVAASRSATGSNATGSESTGSA
jgi:hypothetical protein